MLRNPRILLLNINTAVPRTPSAAFDYLLPYLRDYPVALGDMNLGTGPEMVRELQPDLVLVSIRNVDTALYGKPSFMPGLRQVIRRLRRVYRGPLVAGGIGFTMFPEVLLDYLGLDYGIQGDGEEAVLALVRALEGELPLEDVPGLVYRTPRGVALNPRVARPLSEYPSPVRNPALYRAYVASGIDFGGGVETKRGCDRHCIFCVEPLVKGRRIRTKAPRRVVEEIRAFLSLDIHGIMFLDSEFNNPLEHSLEVLEAIARAGLGDQIEWRAYVQPDLVTREFVDLAVRTGCFRLDIDAISGDDSQLRRMGASFGVADVVRAARLCRERSLPFDLDYIFGGPGDSVQTADRSLRLLQGLGPTNLAGTVGLRIYPGTPLHNLVKARGGLTRENPNLVGYVARNEDLLRPVFYVERGLRRFLPKVRRRGEGETP